MSTLRIYEDMQQRSPQWYEARCGIVTASAMNSLVTIGPPDATTVACPSCKAEPNKPCLSKSSNTPKEIKTLHDERNAAASNLPPVYSPADNDTSKSLIMALTAERITTFTEDTYPSRDMQRGIFAEPYARDLYAGHFNEVTECGFMVRDFDGFSIGFSPDGLVGDDGLIEIKAPRQKRELTTILAGEVPADHIAQIQCGLLVSGRKWLDFISYCGGMPLFVKRVYPDPAWREVIVAAAEKAEREIAEALAKFKDVTTGLPVAKRIDFFDLEVVA